MGEEWEAGVRAMTGRRAHLGEYAEFDMAGRESLQHLAFIGAKSDSLKVLLSLVCIVMIVAISCSGRRINVIDTEMKPMPSLENINIMGRPVDIEDKVLRVTEAFDGFVFFNIEVEAYAVDSGLSICSGCAAVLTAFRGFSRPVIFQ